MLAGTLARRLSLRLASLLQEALKVGFRCLQRGQRPKREARSLNASLRYEARLSCNKGVKVTIKLMRIAKGAGCAEDDRWARGAGVCSAAVEGARDQIPLPAWATAEEGR